LFCFIFEEILFVKCLLVAKGKEVASVHLSLSHAISCIIIEQLLAECDLAIFFSGNAFSGAFRAPFFLFVFVPLFISTSRLTRPGVRGLSLGGLSRFFLQLVGALHLELIA
jgi:hypothetical protein